MVNVAKDAQVDAIKFQTHFGWPGQEQYEFTKDQWRELFDYCEWRKVKWLSTPFDFESIKFLHRQGMRTWKIPSGMMTNREYLKAVRHYDEPESKYLLSTGMADEGEIDDILWEFFNIALSSLRPPKIRQQLTILYCVTAYPAPYEEINLKAMKNYYGAAYGLSDHTLGIEIPIAAVAMGASVIEKHFTLDRNMKGPDHKASLEPDELKKMVDAIRNVEMAMGDGIKRPTPSEMKVRDEIRREMAVNAQHPF